MPNNVNSKLVTIFGGSGFLGRHITSLLAKQGYRVRVAVRRPELAGHLQPLGGVGQIHAVQANIRSENSIHVACEGADIVINLVGILFQSGKQAFRTIHKEGADKIARAAVKCGSECLIHISAIGADSQSPSTYARTKARGEEAVLAEFPDAVILRPSVVFGPEDGLFNRFAELSTFSPALPLIGGGTNRMQPVYVGDVAKAVLAAIEGKAQKGGIYELGGPEILTLKEIMQKTLEFSERKRLLVWVPTLLAQWFIAPVLSLMPNPMLTPDQVKLLKKDNVVSEQAIENQKTFEGLGITEISTVDSIVPAYLERFKQYGQFSNSK